MSTPSIQRRPSFLEFFKKKNPTKPSIEKTAAVASQKLQESSNNNLAASIIPVQLQKIPSESIPTDSSTPCTNQVTLIKPKPPIPPPRSVQGPTPLPRIARLPNKEEGSVFLADIIKKKETLRPSLEQTNNKGILKKPTKNTHPDMNQISTKKSVMFDSTDSLHQSPGAEPTKTLHKELKKPFLELPRSPSTQLSSTIKKHSGDHPETNVNSKLDPTVKREFDQLENEMNALVKEFEEYLLENEKKSH